MKTRFQFGNVVVVNQNQIGVIVKTWGGKNGFNYDVYVRDFNSVENYHEDSISHFIYNKDLTEEECKYY